VRCAAPGSLAVLGIGGVGGVIAARAHALCVGTARAVEAVRGSGLTLVAHDGTTSVARLDAAERLDRPVALLVVAVKAHALEEALERIDATELDGAAVLPLLNGLEHLDVVRAWVDAAWGDAAQRPVVLAGSIGRLEAFSPEPGFVVQHTPGALVTIASDALEADAVDDAVAPLRVPGIEVVAGSGERAVLWDKAARLSALAAATVASGLPVGRLRADPAWRARLGVALGEACSAARAEGVALDPAAQWAIIEAMSDALTTSTARDAAAGRPTELDAITGSVVRAARRAGVPTPELERLLDEAEARCRRR
jgi:2-dehydropantoate 2-reductase